ncbi:MAG: SusC/RagA family TonB-linked outer membrane protein [Bacteroidaceae bacterium]|nr:SusC/RagA family TonB-linked outer membrane protein [Bacteroidaceae bacterium]
MGKLSQTFKASFLGKSCMILFMLLAMSWTGLNAKTVTGKVIDQNQEPLIGATVTVQGTKTATVTDFDGNFSINANDGQTLVVTYIGYITKQVKVSGNNLVIQLQSDESALEEVVVVGYGTMKKSDIAGSVTSVNMGDMMKRAPVNIAQGLQGAAAGVSVTMQDGAPDANAAIRIRGIGTINGDPRPLYVVDGIQVGTDANFLNPADIESIEILKDASATAIYGSAGANGVIMITTKHGFSGQTNITATVDFGIQTLPYKLQTLGIEDYAATVREARYNQTGSYNTTNVLWNEKYNGQRNYIDWQKEMTRAAIRQQYGISANGGNEKSTYSFSAGYLNNDGLVVGTNMKRLNLRANVTTQATNYLKVGGDISYVLTESNGSNIGNSNNGNLSSIRDYAFWSPTLDYVDSNVLGNSIIHPNLVNPDGSYGASQLFFSGDDWEGMTRNNCNPYARQMELSKALIRRNNRVNASAFIEITFLKGLTLKSVGSYSYYGGEDNRWEGGNKRFNYINGTLTDMSYSSVQNQDYSFGLGNSSSYNLGIETYLTYHLKTGVHDLTLMAGNTVGKSYGQWVSAAAAGFLTEWNRVISLAPDVNRVDRSNGGFNAETRNISYFGRVAYSLMDRYLLTATVRRDGSSNFVQSNRWGTFPSVAVGWRFSEEPFLRNQNVLSNGKIRFGWGQTGNAGNLSGKAIQALTSTDRYNVYGQGGQLAVAGSSSSLKQLTGLYSELVDPNLKWETNEQLNFGIDLAFLGGDLDISLDYFIRNSKDLLLNYQIRSSSGYTQVYTNYGNIRNQGIEASIKYHKQFNKDMSFNVTLNASTLKNRVTKMGFPLYSTNTEGGNGVWNTIDGSNVGAVGDPNGWKWGDHSISMEGSPVGAFFGYRTDGIIQNEAELNAYKEYWAKDIDGKPKANFTNVKVGDFKFKDINGDKVLDENDREVLGHGIPAFTWGLNLGFNYKNWDFSAYLNGVLGQKIFSYSAMRLSTVHMGDDQTFPNILQDSWASVAHVKDGVVTNPDAVLPRLVAVDENYNMRASDAWVKNGNFLRLSNLQVGYTFNFQALKNIGIQNARLYVACSNVFVISPYSKYGDPEIGQGSPLYSGFDTGRYPMPRTFMAGLSVTFGGQKAKKAKQVPVYTPVEPQIVEKVVEKIVEKPVVTEVIKEVVKEVPAGGVYVVNFAVNSTTLSAEAKAELDKVQGSANVVAYASPEGNPEANKKLSEGRAQSVADYLKAKGVTVLNANGEGAPNKASNRIAIVTVK